MADVAIERSTFLYFYHVRPEPAPNVAQRQETKTNPRDPENMGPNDSSIQRGDRADTGDNEARPDEMGSGPAQPTADPTSFGGTSSIRHSETDHFDVGRELADYDGIEVMEADDGRLGLTGTDRVAADDWAADTGETHTAEAEP